MTTNTQDMTDLELNKIKADAIREMVDYFVSTKGVYYDDVIKYADNLEKSDG